MQVLFQNNLPGNTMVLRSVLVNSETKMRQQLMNETLSNAKGGH